MDFHSIALGGMASQCMRGETMKKSYIIVLAMSELNRELTEVIRDIKAEPDFKYLQTKRDVIEGEIKTLYRILADLEEME